MGKARAETVHNLKVGTKPAKHKVKATARKKGTPKVQDDDRSWRTPPRPGRKSPSRSKAASPGRRKSPRRKKGSGGGSGGSAGGASGAAIPHTPASYRDVTVGVAATSPGGLVSHTALARSAGLSRVEAVRKGAPDGPDDGEAVDPAAHAITIGGHIAETCATLTAEQLAALRMQRAAIVAEMDLIETILQDRRGEIRVIDETIAGIRPTTPRRRRSSGASKARTNGTTPVRSKSPKR